jgi:hypothetical protein
MPTTTAWQCSAPGQGESVCLADRAASLAASNVHLRDPLLSKKRSKKRLTSEETINGGWREDTRAFLADWFCWSTGTNSHGESKNAWRQTAANGFTCWSQFVAMMFCNWRKPSRCVRSVMDWPAAKVNSITSDSSRVPAVPPCPTPTPSAPGSCSSKSSAISLA